MERLSDCFAFQGKQVISLIGSGGKTSLMWYLADCYRHEKVLVSTTTKIGYPFHQLYDFFYCQEFSKVGSDGTGITLAGTHMLGAHKLSAPPSIIQQSFPSFDKIFLEADGSKQLPLKGWETFEPVVIPETTVTIGLIPISVLNQKIDETTVHRLPLFLRATGTKTGEVICEETLAEVISSPKGLWAKSRGHRILCINQVETSEQLNQAKKVLALLPCMLMKRLTKVIACNVQSGKGVVLWEK